MSDKSLGTFLSFPKFYGRITWTCNVVERRFKDYTFLDNAFMVSVSTNLHRT